MRPSATLRPAPTTVIPTLLSSRRPSGIESAACA
ncbi:Uncharacterised protein [Mycobacteroides abscessus]|nr:Uncharacterised protein [Mycobacteroides abscessus]